MIKRLIKLLLIIVFIIPCTLYDFVRMVILLIIYAPIVYVIANKSVGEIIDNFKMQGMDFLFKISEL